MNKNSVFVEKDRILLSVIFIASFLLVSVGHARGIDQAKRDLKMYFKDCTAQTGCDSDNLTGIGVNQLDPDERAFLFCANNGIQELIIPVSTVPDAYTGLIAENRHMTDAVEDGKMTRSERKSSTPEPVDENERVEKKEEEKSILDPNKEAREKALLEQRKVDAERKKLHDTVDKMMHRGPFQTR